MDAIQINRKHIIQTITDLKPWKMIEEDGRLLIVFNYSVNHKFTIGQHLVFRRYVYGQNGRMRTISSNVVISEKTTYLDDESGLRYDAIYTTIPQTEPLRLPTISAGKIKIKSNSGACESNYDSYFDGENHYLMVKIGDDFIVNDWLYKEGDRYVLEFASSHDIFAQDIALLKSIGAEYTINVENSHGNVIGEMVDIAVTYTGTSFPVVSSDTLTANVIDTCGKFDVDGNVIIATEYRYVYEPEDFSKRKVMFSCDNIENLINNGVFFYPSYNPYYYFTEDEGRRLAHFWFDTWWNTFSAKSGTFEGYINDGNSRCLLGVESDYWNVPNLTLSKDNSGLGFEDAQENDYVDRIIDNYIPDVIDMERYKYRPYIQISDGEYAPVNELIFDFHFRKRMEKETTADYPIYDDGWYINEESGATTWWNGFDYNGSGFSLSKFNEFYRASGQTSDLLGYLNFTDEDVFYRKSRLSMSFLRLSFYTSTDPLEQKLLYYSTIFLDATGLYGKYIKQATYGSPECKTTPMVFCPYNGLSARLDTEIHIKNEFNSLMSSEGYNLYLFADDATKTDDGKPYRTIYMKVEFNHAGNGKTIPMMQWPKTAVDGQYRYRGVKTDKFLEDLYIPVRVGYIDNKFIYWFPDMKPDDDDDNNNLRFILFEPKLDFD